MAKLTAGQKMPDFSFCTPFEQGRTLAETAKRVSGKTALVFLRYYGCTLCQYDIQQFAARHDLIAGVGGQLLVVLQSDPARLAEQLGEGGLPFDIICDPGQELYRKFEIAPAVSQEQMADISDPATLAKFAALKESGLQHGEYEGNELQLPAYFVVEPDLTLTCAHYSASVIDTPSPEDVAVLLQ